MTDRRAQRTIRPMGEFDLIDRYFKRPVPRNALGVGDDCALLAPAPGMQLAVSSDMLVEGRHFLSTVDPFKLGHKALAVNLSDLAACGAKPLAFTLALAMPQADEAWLEPFSRGLLALADEHGCELVGGDTTRGPLNICITAFGEVPQGQALLRSGARAGRRHLRERHAGRRAAGAGGVPRHALGAGRSVSRRRARAWSSRRRAWRWGRRCAASPPRPSTSATGCSATWATSCGSPASARASTRRSRPA